LSHNLDSVADFAVLRRFYGLLRHDWRRQMFYRSDTVGTIGAQKHKYCICQQEAQLSQRDRVMLLVIEYFAKSLKLTRSHSKRHCWVGRV